ncbi:MAG: hypothetical protein JNM82_04575, partial [Rhodocyclaceae bacterium]|nr:hypothetical protein [Rhodocyclaceae bacterium]
MNASAPRRPRRLAGLLHFFLVPAACTLSLVSAPAARASGGDGGYYENPFVPEHHVAARDLAAYAGGRLGVVPATYWRVYQFLAWRAASGDPLNAGEVDALGISGWTVKGLERVPPAWDDKATGVAAWGAARKRAVPGAGEVQVRVEGQAGDFAGYINC